MSEALFLDTHTWIWLVVGEELNEQTKQRIEQAASVGQLFLSAISVWELGMLVQKGRLALQKEAHTWVAEALQGIGCIPLTPEIALASTQLPGAFHGDPADRMIVASARTINAPLLTRDEKSIDYARQGYLKVIPV